MSQNDVLVADKPKSRILIELMIAVLGSCFLAIMSQVSIPLIVTPVPLTLQTLAVFILGGVLGGRRSAYSVIAYLIQGCCLLPVFAGGISNPLWVIGPQAGFLISFVVAAYVVGKMIERRPQAHLIYYVGALVVAQFIISGVGMVWLSFYLGVSKAFMCGVIPFLSGAALKIMLGSFIIRFYRGRK
jgi:biotin transport system substrate-specific component